MESTPWTLDELSERTRRALDALRLAQQNGQVTDVPNARTIRYYATVGLLDRPAQHGRAAMYGARHLAQLVAIKRLQAAGLTLTQVQERLLGMEPDALVAFAALPADSDSAPQHQPVAPPTRSRRADDFWSATPSAPAPAAPTDAHVLDVPPSPTAPVHGLHLSEGVTLTFVSARPLSDDDMSALRAALGPVVDTLRARGLLAPTSGDPQKDTP